MSFWEKEKQRYVKEHQNLDTQLSLYNHDLSNDKVVNGVATGYATSDDGSMYFYGCEVRLGKNAVNKGGYENCFKINSTQLDSVELNDDKYKIIDVTKHSFKEYQITVNFYLKNTITGVLYSYVTRLNFKVTYFLKYQIE